MDISESKPSIFNFNVENKSAEYKIKGKSVN